VLLHRLLVHFGAPARSIGQHELAVLDHGNMRHQLVPPWHVVDLDLHDAEVQHGGAEMRAHHAGEVAFVVVRCDVGLAGVGERRDP